MEDDLKKVRELWAASEARLPLASVHDVQRTWPVPVNLAGALGDKLRNLLVLDNATGQAGPDLRPLIKAYRFEEATGIDRGGVRRTLDCIWYHTGNVTLRPLSHPEWAEGMDIARGLEILKPSISGPQTSVAAEQAARKMIGRGYRIAAISAMFRYEDGELERATAEIQGLLDRIGIVGATSRIVELLKGGSNSRTGMFLVPRQAGTIPIQRPATPPYAFLLNLAVRSPNVTGSSVSVDSDFRLAVELATDLVASLDLETYSIFETAIVATGDVEQRLRKTAQFGHLVDIAQWPVADTESLLGEFFSPTSVDEPTMIKQLGWNFTDALTFWRYVAKTMPQDRPWKVAKSKLSKSGVDGARLNRLLVDLTHPSGLVNKGYVSPESATYNQELGSMAFLRPFIDLGDGSLLVPLPSAFGPALYEALLMAFRLKFKEPAKKLMGDGTERMVAGLFRKAGFSTLRTGEKYVLRNPSEDGELDVVIETPTDILFVECKAKAPTRATMAGSGAEALLDYAGAIFDGQRQALRHEIILRRRGAIELVGDGRLELNGRQVSRLCVTLLDHGALQDFSLITAVTQALARMEITPVAGFAKAEAVNKLNNALKEFRAELEALNSLGIPFQNLRLSTRSLTVAQLAVVLRGCSDAQAFVKLLKTPVVYGQQNPLLELLTARSLQSATSKSS